MNGKAGPLGRTSRLLLKIYDAGFALLLPLLYKNKRLRDGWPQRVLNDLPAACDLWIQAASGGEAYLALEILRRLDMPGVKTLVTTNTNQGLEVLRSGLGELSRNGVTAEARFCPFDKPAYMTRYLAAVKPKVLVLLETELWPGMLWAAKRQGVAVVLANGRISPKSLKSYLRLKGLFRALAPDMVMAISAADADRFRQIFTQTTVNVVPNIKFDRIRTATAETGLPAVAEYLPGSLPFVVLGSVRKAEEAQILTVIHDIRRQHPHAVIGLYPRHVERIAYWRTLLRDNGMPYCLQSELRTPLGGGSVLLGDVFGELGSAYRRADAVFVGGSLAPLGGQNFMEPLAAGVVPVIGPSWKNFAWVGQGIAEAGLLLVGQTTGEVAGMLNASLTCHAPKDEVKKRFGEYIARNLGGARTVCETLAKLLVKV